ncbi:PEGA domain-containing protein [bacterium]|nr:PEGA domain-containing protein [bacterium]
MIRILIVLSSVLLYFGLMDSALAQQEETNILALLQSALSTAIKTFNSQNQPEAILQLNQIIDICQENRASRELTPDEIKILSQAYDYRGRAFYNIGETGKAQTDFEELIKIMPQYQLDSSMVSPKIVGLFDKIKSGLVGNLAVFSTPSGSEVFINNSFLSLTPMYSTDLLKGEYVLEVKHRGFDVFTERITILANTPLEKEVTLVPNTGACVFYTVPSEVKIYIDGEFMGSTFGQAPPECATLAEQYNIHLEALSAPLRIDYISPGTHRLELRKDCFSPIVQSISVEIKVHEYEPYVLEPSLTSIQVNASIPGSSVYLNDSFKGLTPLTLKDVCTGKYTLSVRKEGKGKWFQEIELKRGEPQVFSAEMRPTLTYMGIINAREKDQAVVSRVNERMATILSSLNSLNFDTLDEETANQIARELGLPLSSLSRYSASGQDLDAKRKSGILAELGTKLNTDLMLFAYLPDEKLQRHVHLELFSRYHDQGDSYKLAFSDQIETSTFVAKMDNRLQLFSNWIGLVAIDTLLHEGIVVVSVMPGSPAEAAGVKVGDIITKLDNDPIVRNKDFTSKLNGYKQGDTIRIKVVSVDSLTQVVAIEVKETAVEMPRNSPKYFYNKAISELKQKIMVEGNQDLIHYYQLNLGICYMHYNNWQKAIEDAFSQASLPSQPGISMGTLNYYIAVCYQNLGYSDEAIKFFNLAASAPGATLESNDGPSVEFLAKKKLDEFGQR